MWLDHSCRPAPQPFANQPPAPLPSHSTMTAWASHLCNHVSQSAPPWEPPACTWVFDWALFSDWMCCFEAFLSHAHERPTLQRAEGSCTVCLLPCHWFIATTQKCLGDSRIRHLGVFRSQTFKILSIAFFYSTAMNLAKTVSWLCIITRDVPIRFSLPSSPSPSHLILSICWYWVPIIYFYNTFK